MHITTTHAIVKTKIPTTGAELLRTPTNMQGQDSYTAEFWQYDSRLGRISADQSYARKPKAGDILKTIPMEFLDMMGISRKSPSHKKSNDRGQNNDDSSKEGPLSDLNAPDAKHKSDSEPSSEDAGNKKSNTYDVTRIHHRLPVDPKTGVYDTVDKYINGQHIERKI